MPNVHFLPSDAWITDLLSSAVQFTTYEQLKKVRKGNALNSCVAHDLTRVLQWFTAHGTIPLDTPTRLCSGALAGITSVCACSGAKPSYL